MQSLVENFVEQFGAASVVDAEQAKGRPISGYGDAAPAVPILRPANTAELSAMLKACHAVDQTVIPLGGGTGLVGGTRSSEAGGEWYVSLERMRAIESVDPVNRVAIVQAGVPLVQVQQEAVAAGLAFAIDLGARDSAQIGGLIATNAGGDRVVRFGMMREQILGLEVVLADGTVLDLMDSVIKNNQGYDLRQVFIGSEGTLGIVSRAVLRLRPALPASQTAFIALSEFEQVKQLLRRVEHGMGGQLSAFELMWPEFYQIVLDREFSPHRPPLPRSDELYVLLEAEMGEGSDEQRLFEILGELLEEGVINDAAVAQSGTEREAFWAIRNDSGGMLESLRYSLSYDVSLAIADMEQYVADVRENILARWPEAIVVAFGHVADNNLHISVSIGEDTQAHSIDIGAIVHGPVIERGGAISAEHGVGLDKRRYLQQNRTPEVIAAMRSLKVAMDPKGILNPGKMFLPLQDDA